jgi:hypothetical protein
MTSEGFSMLKSKVLAELDEKLNPSSLITAGNIQKMFYFIQNDSPLQKT